eukprot:TRINITY_DN666_c0_g1_i1.p1 TRINITY_DN666_c0_g1~~TRINITY_DN666_c0_g1_i1.p1  ORF type:complete len:724 (-),score=225.24 TRINITY_DN666_c0_g1_i1:665-2836(-)
MPAYRLKYDPAELPAGGVEVIAPYAAPQKYSFEPAGHSFHSAALRLAGVAEEAEEVIEEAPVKEPNAGVDPSSWQSGKKKKGSEKEGGEQDHYALLGLGHLRYLATEDQIKKAYREVALKHHPDKQAALLLAEETEEAKEAKREEIDNNFKAIQVAYEVLTDPVRRRVYDSTDEFDDAIPSDCSPEEFFKIFGPVFQRNARWSTLTTVPSLGVLDTSIEEVDKFYDFWFSFKSWREFPQEDEFDIEQAENREHKRWMERQNSKLREKAKKEENSRIRELVENAYRKDPRIQKRKDDEKAEKERRKQAKKNAKKEKEEEEKRIAEEQRQRKLEEDKRQAEEAAIVKKQKEKEKKALRKEKQRLRTAAGPCVVVVPPGRRTDSGMSADDMEDLCAKLDFEQVKSLCDKLEAEGDLQKKLQLLNEALGKETESRTGGAALPNGAACSTPSPAPESTKGKSVATSSVFVPKKENPWKPEELELLRKGLVKFPKGTSQRWEVVSNYIGTGRSVEEILKAIKQDLLRKPDDSKAFDSFLTKRKNPKEIASPLTSRDEVIDAVLPPPTASLASSSQSPPQANGHEPAASGPQPAAALTSEVNEAPKKPPVTIPLANGNAATPKLANGVAKKEKEVLEPKANGTVEEPKSDAKQDSPSKAAEVPEDTWTEIQELALVKALKAFPKETDKRWDRIAAAVPGKSKAQCFKRFAYMRENFRAKKGAGAAGAAGN